MLRLEPLEPRDTPAVVVDVALDFATGRYVAEGGVLRVGEIALDGDRSFAAPSGEIVRPVSGADAHDRITLVQIGNAVTIADPEGVVARVHFLGLTTLTYCSEIVIVGSVTAIDVNLQLGGNDTVGNNTLLSATIAGGAGDDTIVGSVLAPNVISGGAGNDVLIGGLGADVFDGGTGSDVMLGFVGADLYLAADAAPDLTFEVAGCVVIGDPFDL